MLYVIKNNLSKKVLFNIIFALFNIFLLILLINAIIDISTKTPVYFEVDVIIIGFSLLWPCFLLYFYLFFIKSNNNQVVDENNEINRINENNFEMNNYGIPTNNHLTRFSSIVII